MNKANLCPCLKIFYNSVSRTARDNGYSVGHLQKCDCCDRHNPDSVVLGSSGYFQGRILHHSIVRHHASNQKPEVREERRGASSFGGHEGRGPIAMPHSCSAEVQVTQRGICFMT